MRGYALTVQCSLCQQHEGYETVSSQGALQQGSVPPRPFSDSNPSFPAQEGFSVMLQPEPIYSLVERSMQLFVVLPKAVSTAAVLFSLALC